MPKTITIQRGILKIELTKKGRLFLDKDGNEYVKQLSHGRDAYYLKKAILVNSKMYIGICSKNDRHRKHRSDMPLKKEKAAWTCSCGGTVTYDEVKPQPGDGKK